jgi:hypothetical protein
MATVIKRWAGPGIVFFVGLGFQVTGFHNVWVGYGFWIVAAAWAFIVSPPIRRRIPFFKESAKLTQEGTLRIEVQKCDILDFWPQPDNWLSRIFGHMSIVEVKAKFYPGGEIKLHSLELHMGRHTFGADSLPVIVLDREDTYSIEFQVPSRVITTLLKKSDTKYYLRAIYNDRDCRSNDFPISLAYELK